MDSTDPAGPDSVDILGCRLDLVTPAECREWVRSALTSDQTSCRHVVTLNPEYVIAARRDPAFGTVLNRAELVTADGAGVVAAARLIHGKRVERVTGVDLTGLLAESSVANAPLYLLGAGPGVARLAGDRLSSTYPGARIAGSWGGGTPEPRFDRETIARIAESGARAVVVAYGAPGQIHWIERNREALAAVGVRVVIGVGGALDYLSGATPRPPLLIRRLGLEWLVRLVREPKRWRRQLVLPVFVFLTVTTAARHRLTGRS